MSDPDAGGIALALIGLFYTFAAIVTIRVSAINMLLTQALASLSPVDPREEAAERNRAWLLGLMAVLYGAGGILLVLRLDLAAAVFAVSCLLYGLYLSVIAPKWLDPWDPPEAPGRARTRNAFFIYLGATAIVLAAWHAGALRRPQEESPWVLAAAAILILSLAGYALHAFRPWRRHHRVEMAAFDDDAPEMPVNMVLTPSWGGTGLVDAASGEPVWFFFSRRGPPDADWQAITAWNDIYRQTADPDDPLGLRFRDPEGEARLERVGRPLYERLAGRLGAERLSFEPQPRPNLPQQAFPACKIAIDGNGDPLHCVEADGDSFLAPVRSGISWTLVNALGDWAYRHPPLPDPDAPAAPPVWTAEAAAAHRAEGRALAVRLAGELAATGRAHVAVWYAPHGDTAERIA